jgi:formate hydrogenlyase transcriptional activator
MISINEPLLHGLDEDAALRAILAGTAAATGEQFFTALVKNLAQVLGTYTALIEEYSEESQRLRVLAYWAEEDLAWQGLEFGVKGTPCEAIIAEKTLFHFPDNVQALFPDDEPFKQIDAAAYMGVPLLSVDGKVLGTLSVVNKRPFPREPRGVALMRIFADRAAAELQRLRAEAALREREERYRDLYDEAPIAYQSVGVDGRIRSANSRAAELFGYTMNQLIGRPVFDLMADTSEGKGQGQKIFQRFLSGEEIRGEELEYRRADGGQLWISLSVRPIKDAEGKILASRSILEDITMRKQTEQALRASEQRFRRLVEHAADAFLVLDGEGRFVDVNQRACDSLGYSREELLAMSVADVQMEFSLERLKEVWKRMVPGVPVTLEGVHRRKDGSVFPVEVRVGLIEWDGRQHQFALARDVTERKRNEQALRESEEWYRDFYVEAPIAYFSVGIDSRIRQANKRGAELLGCPLPELLGRSAFDFMADTPSGKPKAQQKLFPKLLAGEEVRSEELEVRRADGEQVWVSLSFKPIRDAQGQVIADRSQVEDITARKRLEQALQQYSEKLQKLVDERTAQLRQSEERQRALLEINNAIISNLDRDSLFEAIAKTLHSILPFDRLSLYIYDPASDLLKGFAATGIAAQKTTLSVGINVPRQGSLMGRAVDEKRPIIGRDLRDERPASVDAGIIAKLIELGIRSLLTLPLITKGKVIGVLNFTSLTPDQYSERDAEFLQEIAKQVALAVENMQAYEEIAQLKARLEQENIYLQEEIKTQHNFEEIIGRSQAIKKVLQAVETVAPTDVGVLILGETGTGKELVARAIHNLSRRKESVLVKVNCAALPAGLIESELFGHEKGAFTGALARKIGRFETANGGTIFLDEIGDLPLDLQAKLLRVLQEGEFERVGSSQTLKVEVRVIAATNRDLEKAVQENQFRSDLFYRLNVFPIRLPSLQERKEDIPLLVRHLVLKYNIKLGKKIEVIPPKIMEALQAYSWPGNVRELENIIERAVIISQGSRLDPGEWLPKLSVTLRASRIPTLQELEREHIISVLETAGWRVSGERGAAKLLGMKPTTLEARMKKLGIERKR